MCALYGNQVKMTGDHVRTKEPAKTVMVPNFSAFNNNSSSSSNHNNSRRLSPSDGVRNSSRQSSSSGGRGGGEDWGRYSNSSRSGSSNSRYSSSRVSDRGDHRKPPEPGWKRQAKYYCDVCCVNCVGEQSFEAHMSGQPHLKRVRNAAIQQKEMENASTSGGGVATKAPENFCQVCNVACSSSEAYTAHIRGQKHQKSMKLWQSLGKPIPESLKPQVVKVIPKTNFTVGGTLNTLTGKVRVSKMFRHRDSVHD